MFTFIYYRDSSVVIKNKSCISIFFLLFMSELSTLSGEITQVSCSFAQRNNLSRNNIRVKSEIISRTFGSFTRSTENCENVISYLVCLNV